MTQNTLILSCPTCRQQLNVPWDRGSLTITCPKCRTSWDWAPPAASEVVSKKTAGGRPDHEQAAVTPNDFLPYDLRELQKRVISAEVSFQLARKRYNDLSRRSRLRSLYRRMVGDQEIGISVFFSVIGSGLVAITTAWLSDGWVAATITTAGVVFIGLFIPQYLLVSSPPAKELPNLVRQASRSLANASLQFSHLTSEFKQSYESNLEVQREIQRREQAIAAEIQRREQAIAARRHREELVAFNWRDLSGIEFEHFLERVFRELGFRTETTKASGDQGADLILTSGSVKIAVQAKGYSGSVGNDAVKDALLGRHFYGCTHCLVVTNSKFTSGAKKAAVKAECMLIDGDKLPEMIRGQIQLPGMYSMPHQSG